MHERRGERHPRVAPRSPPPPAHAHTCRALASPCRPHLPGAGLGGGSGNAATTLFAANKLMGGIASNEDLLEWSGEIGSDISVFFSNTGAAYCTGRGEVVEDVPPPVPLDTPMLLVGTATGARGRAGGYPVWGGTRHPAKACRS